MESPSRGQWTASCRTGEEDTRFVFQNVVNFLGGNNEADAEWKSCILWIFMVHNCIL